MILNPGVAPSGNFSLSDWKITLPIDSFGTISGTATEIKSLSGYQHSSYFYTASDGAMVFYAPVDGATTSGSKYARSELREMKGVAKAAWSLNEGGLLNATLEVDQAPIRFDGSAGRVVVGQIHGQNDELVRLYWENGSVYFVNDRAGSHNSETTFKLTNSIGQTPNVSLNERFSYIIDAKGDDLKVSVLADGQTYSSSTRINDVWDTDTFYFKAGTYLGVNETQGFGAGQTSFYALDFTHTTDTSGNTVVPDVPMSLRPSTSKAIENIATCALQYIASYGDLANALGANAAEGSKHFSAYGQKEGRGLLFNGLEYIASYSDLTAVFGGNAEAGALHYITCGRGENRQITFNGLEYIASYGDLVQAFGANADAGAAHYIDWGKSEGRQDIFDSQAYVARYADLQAAFGSDLIAVTQHYITHGYYEGRVWM
ncbi:polysaccharide lyase family 7 protein [Microvirga arabica]|uniref:polysaccharide lyase family 7 protein n=1 Tax=Microvirga arabica TaxID=1128671 RepID=UPI00193AD725|nr:polysaccharide lyase family 7 protein [Microvirga arabica]MBM1173036.1 polysaccharide lyase family 7 protein [Microvirga arabica]